MQALLPLFQNGIQYSISGFMRYSTGQDLALGYLLRCDFAGEEFLKALDGENCDSRRSLKVRGFCSGHDARGLLL